MIYIDDDLQRFTAEEIAALIQRFPRQRRESLSRYTNEAARRQGALAYLLLGDGLRKEYGIVSWPTFSYGEYGKPYLAEHPGIHFSLSHCLSAVACAVSRSPVGIDIESIRTAKPDLVRHTMNAAEAQSILSSPDPNREFTILWTRKEAVLKLSGRGIVGDMQDVLTSAPSSVSVSTMVRDTYIFSEAHNKLP